MLIRVFAYILLICTTLFAEYPKAYSQLGTPLFESSKKLASFKDMDTLTPEIEKFQQSILLVQESGKQADTTQEKEAMKAYLGELRSLQKSYDFLLHLIHKEIVKSIEKEEYKKFIRLTSTELQGLLEKKVIKNRALEFYKKHREEQKCTFLEKKIDEDTLFEATTEEFYNEIVASTYDPSKVKGKGKKSVSIYTTRVKNQIEVYFLNTNVYDVTVGVVPRYKNIKALNVIGDEFVLKAKASLHYATLNLQGSSSYGYSYFWIIGNKDAVHNDEYFYRLPYARGSAQRVSQGYNGAYTHKGSSRYAIDFAMPEGTKVYAAREGVVIRTKSDSNTGGYDKKFAKDGNFVTIAHDDATIATYYHLKQGGVVVNVGQKISRGEHIGYSGNTGYSSGPHLHFAVFTAKSAKATRTIAVRFKSEEGEIEELLQGHAYTAK
ncbi:MAG: M23 family metallopeptidase [Campylobacterales bacterium]|nr:M23 family metallopeptidase [Campylobacterales bacterium]